MCTLYITLYILHIHISTRGGYVAFTCYEWIENFINAAKAQLSDTEKSVVASCIRLRFKIL